VVFWHCVLFLLRLTLLLFSQLPPPLPRRLLGVVFRHCVLFPLRLTLLLTSHLVFFMIFSP
jgi:hypothetical protein